MFSSSEVFASSATLASLSPIQHLSCGQFRFYKTTTLLHMNSCAHCLREDNFACEEGVRVQVPGWSHSAFSSPHTQRRMPVFTLTLWRTILPTETSLEGVAPCVQASSWLELAPWGLKRELVPLLPNARLQAGTPHQAPRLAPNCGQYLTFHVPLD